MRTIFITRRKHNLDEFKPDVIKDDLGREFPIYIPVAKEIEIVDNLDMFHEYMKNHDEIGADTENSGLHPILCTPLLSQFAFMDETSFVIDRGTIKEDFLTPYKEKMYWGHNFQYDYMVFKWHYGVELRRCGDTMVTAQVLGRGSGRSNSLDAEHNRRLGIPMPEDKHTRSGFIGMTPGSLFNTKQILYSGYDPLCVLLIKEKQKELIDHYKLGRRVYEIAHPIIPVLGDMCLNGFTLDTVKWRQILNENKVKQFELALALDAEIVKFSKNEVKLRGGIWTRKRRKQELEQLDMFGTSLMVNNENLKNVSYGSNKQLCKLFSILREPIPQKIDKDGGDWQNKKMMNSFAEEALEQYKIEYPSSRMITFINLLLKYKELDKAISSFGEIFLKDKIKIKKSKKYRRGYMNAITNKVHTIYKQEFTKNGRLASGDGIKKLEEKLGLYNSQQMIKENRYRNCFTLTPEEIADGWLISTYDLSAAELVILASHSKDPTLIKIIKNGEDLHSYLATSAYTSIIKYIINTMSETRAYDEIANLSKPNRIQKALLKEVEKDVYVQYTDAELDEIHRNRITSAFKNQGVTINKKDYPDIREPFKNVVYGVNYGAGEEKVAETLNIAKYYAKLVLEGMEAALPQAFAYLDRISRFGVKHGYIIFNDRTNSRHWFKSWLEAKESGRQLSGKEVSAIKRACKNYGISGTQADMIKEAMAALDKYVIDNNIEFEWLLQVHDELVFKHKNKEFGKEAGKVITDTCNLYLDGIEMKVSGHTGIFWNK